MGIAVVFLVYCTCNFVGWVTIPLACRRSACPGLASLSCEPVLLVHPDTHGALRYHVHCTRCGGSSIRQIYERVEIRGSRPVKIPICVRSILHVEIERVNRARAIDAHLCSVVVALASLLTISCLSAPHLLRSYVGHLERYFGRVVLYI